MMKVMTQKKRKNKATHGSFPLVSFLTQGAESRKVLLESAPFKKWNKNSWVWFVQHFYRPIQNKMLLLLFNRSVVSDSLGPHGQQHTRLPCPTLSPGVCSNSCPWSHWCHPTISPSVTPSPPAPNLPQLRVLPSKSALCIRWPKYWSFSISPSNEYSGLISFRIDWFDLLAVQRDSRVFSNTTVWKHQFFNAQPSL